MNINIKSIVIFIGILLSVHSCISEHDENERKIERYGNGNIKSITVWRNGEKHGVSEYYSEDGVLLKKVTYLHNKATGVAEEFYPNGVTAKSYFLHDSVMNGSYNEFYPNGNLKVKGGQFINGNKSGVFCFYNEMGVITGKNIYLIVQGNSILNEYVRYNKSGNIDFSQSHCLVVLSQKDTISFGENFEMDIVLTGAYFNKMQVIIGNYDEEFNLIDSNMGDTLFDGDGDYKIRYTHPGVKEGRNLIRGIVKDYKDTIFPGGYPGITGKDMFFEKEFWVEAKDK